MWLRLRDSLLAVQPLLAAPIFFSVLLGVPPLWLSWLVGAKDKKRRRTRLVIG